MFPFRNTPRLKFWSKRGRHMSKTQQKEAVTVDGEALAALRGAVVETHGKLYGNLFEEASVALRRHAENLQGEN